MKYGKVETEKLYFSSNEAAELVGVPVEILHAWEKEFKELKPKKNRAGKRIYRPADIDIAKEIKNGKTQIKQPKTKSQKQKTKASKDSLLGIRDNLQCALNRLRIKRN